VKVGEKKGGNSHEHRRLLSMCRREMKFTENNDRGEKRGGATGKRRFSSRGTLGYLCLYHNAS
jgi:hypothetical protein